MTPTFFAALPPSSPGVACASPAGKRHVPLDGLRGVAIWMVLMWHYYACPPHPGEGVFAVVFNAIAAFGWVGVPVFFVLSGFLIGRIVIAEQSRRDFFFVFYLRRACRILPLYALLLVVAAIASLVLLPRHEAFLYYDLRNGAPGWTYWVFIQNFFMAQTGNLSGWLAVTWSLAIEEQFYLLLPLAAHVIAPRRLPHALVAGVFMCWLFRFAAFASGASTHFLMLTLPGRADGLLMGVLLAWAWETPRVRVRLERHVPLVLLLSVTALVVFLMLNGGLWPGVGGIVFVVLAFALISVPCVGCILTTLVRPSGPLARLLSWRLFVWSGAISYFVYLFHIPVNSTLHGLILGARPRMDSGAGAAVTFFSLLLVGALGLLSRRYLEGPILSWGRRVHLARRGTSLVAEAGALAIPTLVSADRTRPS